MLRNKKNKKNKGSLCLFLKYMALNLALKRTSNLKFVCICMEKWPYGADSSGIFYFFKLENVPVI